MPQTSDEIAIVFEWRRSTTQSQLVPTNRRPCEPTPKTWNNYTAQLYLQNVAANLHPNHAERRHVLAGRRPPHLHPLVPARRIAQTRVDLRSRGPRHRDRGLRDSL